MRGSTELWFCAGVLQVRGIWLRGIRRVNRISTESSGRLSPSASSMPFAETKSRRRIADVSGIDAFGSPRGVGADALVTPPQRLVRAH